MKKLALNIEELNVETFSTDSDETGPRRGTVRARESGSDSYYDYSCDCWSYYEPPDGTENTFCGSCYCNTNHSCPAGVTSTCGNIICKPF